PSRRATCNRGSPVTTGGFVSLVGAGPGDPGLLTVTAARRLADADVVFHDALVSPQVLALARGAVHVAVGKRAGRASTTQEAIHRRLIQSARRGRKVVRLKGGDPYVLGRGGEEALALSEAGIPFEVVPGVSSALSAPALSGIPVTHRGLSSAVLIVSGHAESAYRAVLSALPPGRATLVVLMGLSNRAPIASLLIERGWSPSTPAAICLAASTPAAATWTGRLDELGGAACPPGLAGTIVIGEVVTIASRIAARAAPLQPSKERIHAALR
ncbi:MAG TPA: uroporphyrinogen-III C-methyltransferase, partial [Thermoanaerobaculia bacterium]